MERRNPEPPLGSWRERDCVSSWGTIAPVEVNQIALHVTFRVIGVTEAKSKPL